MVKKYDGEAYPIIKNKGRYNNKAVEIYGFNPSSVYEENWPLLDKKEMHGIVSEMERYFCQRAVIYPRKIKLDDFLELEINDKKIRIQVGGIYADYGNPHNQLMMQLKLLKHFFHLKFRAPLQLNLTNQSFKFFQ